MSRSISNASGFLWGKNYSPVGFCLTELPTAMILEETDGYTEYNLEFQSSIWES